MANDFQDIAALQVEGEELPKPIQSADYVEFKTTEPGDYISNSRSISGRKRDDGHWSFQVTFDSGLTNESTGKFEKPGKYPLKTYISTKQYEVEGKGFTSSVAEYLKRVGLFSKGMTLGDVKEAIQLSASIPVGVFISRTDRGVKQPDGTYLRKNLKLKDFNIGTEQNPVWAEQVTIDGTTYRASAKVGSFKKVA